MAAIVSAAAASGGARAFPSEQTVVLAESKASEVTIQKGVSVQLRSGREIFLLVTSRPGETWADIWRRFGRSSSATAANRAPSGSKTSSRGGLGGGETFAMPFADLSEDWKVRSLRNLFPADTVEGENYVHRPGESPVETYGEGLWQVAEWLTGSGENFRSIVRAGPTLDPAIQPEEQLRIPASLVLPAQLRVTPVTSASIVSTEKTEGPPREPVSPEEEASSGAPQEPQPRAVSPAPAQRALPYVTGANGELAYGEDSTGRHALYRLKAGEALYSAVVVRFTGRIDPDEVNEAASRIAQFSGIDDVTNIPVGRSIRIPIDLLLPEFLPPGDPRRQESDRALAEARRYHNPARAKNLQGVHVILDAGHGGVDPGAIANGVHEHEYVYDVLCRLKRLLETETSATVHPTIIDRQAGYLPRESRSLAVNGAEEILTDPPHFNGDSGQTALGVNLRWYLSNSIYRRLLKDGVPAERVVFISLHADSLHPTLRGGMIYIPGQRYRTGTYGFDAVEYARYTEVRERSRISLSRSQGLRSEGLSREFATRIVETMRQRGLAVHPYMPVRDRIIRKGRAWVPAVLRANQVPVEVLVEIANLNNREDAKKMKDPRFRETMARVLVDALRRYYLPS